MLKWSPGCWVRPTAGFCWAPRARWARCTPAIGNFGGKIELGEAPYAALVRELQEELAITVTAATPWLVQQFVYPHAHVRLRFYRVSAWQGEPQAQEGQQLNWQTPASWMWRRCCRPTPPSCAPCRCRPSPR
ncbi:MAG: NUDIX domain-containing protein [Rivihabitans pingtungensis]